MALHPEGDTSTARSFAPISTWLQLEASEGPANSVIDDVTQRSLAGVTVRGVFAQDECRRGVEALDGANAPSNEAMFGSMVGMPLAELARLPAEERHIGRYLDTVDLQRSHLGGAFGFDLGLRVTAALRNLVPTTWTVQSPVEAGRSYAVGNLRRYEPGGPGLPAHVGSEFLMHDDGSLDHLRSLARTRDHFSWFVIVQEPAEGGQLEVFDASRETYQPEATQWGPTGREDREFDSLPSTLISPDAGSLVLFGGGWHWHRVRPILGDRARMTYGGFAALGHEAQRLYVWF